MLKPGGRVYVTQCFHNRPAPLTARLKPMLRRFTSIDFGRVVLAAEIAEIAEGECWVESVACSLSLLSRRLVRTPPCCALAARRLPASGVLGELGARGLELLRT